MTIRAGLFDDVARIVVDRLGDSIVYDPAGSATALDGAFDADYERLEMSGGVPIASVAPMLFVRLADLPAAPVKGDRLYVRGNEYEVRVVRPDGQAGAELDLIFLGAIPAP